MKIGLVLAGGGARGAYQIGVWKALIELGIDKYINAVSGTSIGALNAVMFMEGQYELAEQFWLNVTKEQILPECQKNFGIKSLLFGLGARNMEFVRKYIPKAIKGGTISREGIDEIFERIDFNLVRDSKIKGYATCTRIPELKPEYFVINEKSTDDIKKILLASTALPIIYGSEGINDIDYVDGGVIDNVPIQPLYGEGCNIIIVVQLSKETLIDKSRFPNTYIIEIVANEPELIDVKDMLDFDLPIIKKRMSKGYMDTIYMIKPIMELTNIINNKESYDIKGNSITEKFKKIFNKGK